MQIAFNIVTIAALGWAALYIRHVHRMVDLALDHMAWQEERMAKLENWPELTEED